LLSQSDYSLFILLFNSYATFSCIKNASKNVGISTNVVNRCPH